MEGVEISEMERGCLRRQHDDHEDLVTRVTQLIKRKEGEEGVELWKKHSIYKVRADIAAVNPEAFAPKVVSMGPYHHGKEHLMPMELHKQRAARRFIEDSGKSIEDFIDGLWEVLPELIDSYSHLDRVWRENKGSFLEKMLIDGCFLLEMLRTRAEAKPYDDHDPVFSFHGIIFFNPQMRGDMMMLENQVPFTALEKLLSIKNGQSPEENSEYLKKLMLVVLHRRKDPDVSKCMHMLDVARHGLFKFETVPSEERSKFVAYSEEVIEHGGLVLADEKTLKYMGEIDPFKKPRSVTELCRAGVKFRKAEDEMLPLTSIKFSNGEITIPVIPLHYISEIEGCNMVAFELIHPGTSFQTLSYFTFMKGLLTSAADVRHLRALKIIQSTDLSDDCIVQTFKRFAMGIPIATPGTKLYQVQDELYQFYEKRMEGFRGKTWEWYTSLKEKYFKNPWTSIAVVSAALLLSLTMAQTCYTALSYWDNNHKNN